MLLSSPIDDLRRLPDSVERARATRRAARRGAGHGDRPGKSRRSPYNCRPFCPRNDENSVDTESLRDRVIISLRGVDVTLNGRKLLSNIHWELRAGEHWGVVGENGSGKTSLLKL